MTRHYAIFLALLIMQIILGGCTFNHQVAPERHPFDDSYLPALSIKNPVLIVAHHDNKPSEIICNYVNTRIFHAKMDVLTDDAVATLTDVLRRKNIPVDANAKKALEIAVVGANCEFETWTFKYNVKIKVLFDGAVAKEFTGSQRTGNLLTTNSTISDATTYAVLEMLKDGEIVKYLER